MAQKPEISTSFVKTASLFITVITATVLTVSWGMDKFKDTIRDEIKPLVDRIDRLEGFRDDTEDLLAVNTPNIEAVTKSVTRFIDYYNLVYHKEFLRPADISLTSIKRRR